jgi:DNA-binding protein Fis
MELDPQSLADVEMRHILHVLKSCNVNKTAAAKVLGLARSTLVLKLKEYAALNMAVG